MGRGHNTDFESHSGSTPTLRKIALSQVRGPTDVGCLTLSLIDGVPVGNRQERRMAARELRRRRDG